jgi:N-methylhydantoinase B
MTRTLSPIRLQVLWRRLLAIVEEQAQTIMRSAFCTIVRESGDLSVVLYDRRGRMVAQAQTGTPGFINTMADFAGHVMEAVPPTAMAPGDAYVTNDPWLACGHLNDVAVLSPLFVDGTLVGFIGSAAHVVDIGGRGLGPDASQIFEEGLAIPILPLYQGGRLNETLVSILRLNVREPAQVEGDILALAASNEAGARAVATIMGEYGLADLEAVSQYIIDSSRQGMVAEIGKLSPGTYAFAMTIDGYDAPVRLAASMTIGAREIRVDFAGTSSVTTRGINVPLNYSQAYTWFGIKCVVAPEVPVNAGSIEPIKITAPDNCIVHARRPWPVAARHVVGHMLPDVVIGCLSQAVPGGCQAESGAALWGPQFRGGPEVRAMLGLGPDRGAPTFTALTVHSGGCGGRPGKDGLSATAFPTNLRTVPVEVIETGVPLVVWRREYRPDSAGAGQFRGGFGQVVEIGAVDDGPFIVNAMFDRVDHPARGRDGGADGAPGVVRLASGRKLRAKGQQIVPPGDRLRLETPGGGGLGDPRRRDPAKIAADLESGLISFERAPTQCVGKPTED